MASKKNKRTREIRDSDCSLHISKDSFAIVYDSMLKSKQFCDLTINARMMYICCRNQLTCETGRQCLYKHAKEEGIVYPEDCFVMPAKQLQEYGYLRQNGNRYLKELIKNGFIEKYEANANRWKINVYRFSDEWKRK